MGAPGRRRRRVKIGRRLSGAVCGAEESHFGYRGYKMSDNRVERRKSIQFDFRPGFGKSTLISFRSVYLNRNIDS